MLLFVLQRFALAKSRTFPVGVPVLLVRSYVYTAVLRGHTLDRGVVSAGVTPWKKAGRPMGASTPQCSSSKVINLSFILLSATKNIVLGLSHVLVLGDYLTWMF